MATSLGTFYGSNDSLGRFRVGADVQYTETDASKGYHIQYRQFIDVIKTASKDYFTQGMAVSWSSTYYPCGNKIERVGQSGWFDGGWVQYPNSFTIPNTYCYYKGGSTGTTYRSDMNGKTVAMPGPLTYTVSFNANGGSGAPGAVTGNVGSSVTIPSTRPSRTGYNFLGWATSSTGSAAYQPGGTISSGATLYAVWSIITYTVSYNANGGSGAPGAQTKTYGQNLTLSGTRPTRTGYSFQGWATSSTGSAVYQPSGTYSNNAAVTLYAVWSINKYTVSYNANGGSGAPGAQTKTYGQNLTLSSTRPTRTNYDFQGWATSASGSVAYQPGGTYSSNAAVTLYAIWKIGTFTVNYYANGGTGAPAAATANKGTQITVSSTQPTRTGYIFQGWATSSTGGVAYRAGDKISSATNLYAVWTLVTYPVYYNANGGSGAPGQQTKTYGQTLTLSSTRPTRYNYDFLGWATSASGAVAYQPGGSYTSNSPITLYAVWKQRANGYMKFSTGWEPGMVYQKFSDGWHIVEAKEKTGSGWKNAGI